MSSHVARGWRRSARRHQRSGNAHGLVVAAAHDAFGDTMILALEPRGRNAHPSEDPIAFREAVPVGTAARDEAEKIDQCAKARGILGGMAGMPNFDTIETSRHECLDALARARLAGVREHREASGVVYHLDGLSDEQPIFGHVRWPAVAEIAIECIAEVRGPTLVHQSASDVWPAQCAPRRLGEHVLERDPHAKLVEAPDDCLPAGMAHHAKLVQAALDRPRIAQMQTKQVRFVVALHGTQLHAGHDAHPLDTTSLGGLGESGDGIVVGERDGCEPDLAGGTRHCRRRTRTIGSSRVRVQIDEHVDGSLSGRSPPREK